MQLLTPFPQKKLLQPNHQRSGVNDSDTARGHNGTSTTSIMLISDLIVYYSQRTIKPKPDQRSTNVSKGCIYSITVSLGVGARKYVALLQSGINQYRNT